ncbi:hypothetical protein HGM15179_015316 [Zosterops borbonicus]|uniref:Uncharacterized protein n=1 Tax=Zosterops borbonicus TaxID=364589 RepID=A0A8K1LF83_9PASS|nr:hypothetical protein HGM15179_015316 [Zosterops borbonicus]
MTSVAFRGSGSDIRSLWRLLVSRLDNPNRLIPASSGLATTGPHPSSVPELHAIFQMGSPGNGVEETVTSPSLLAFQSL